MGNKKNKSVFADPFAASSKPYGRKENVRTEREVRESLPLICLNFKDFDHTQCPPGQTYEDWQTSGKLAILMKKFEHICQMTRTEAVAQQVLKVYGAFPEPSAFRKPAHVQGDVEWGTIQRIGGQRPRLAGYIIDFTFYPVFLDADHLFFPSEKKHT
jgi:hypothetical protein